MSGWPFGTAVNMHTSRNTPDSFGTLSDFCVAIEKLRFPDSRQSDVTAEQSGDTTYNRLTALRDELD
jgi:hypothetical protein